MPMWATSAKHPTVINCYPFSIIYPIAIRYQINRIPSTNQPRFYRCIPSSDEQLIFQRYVHLGERNTQIQFESRCTVVSLRGELNCTG